VRARDRRRGLGVALAVAATLLRPPASDGAAAPTGLCATVQGDQASPPYLAIVSAFPAEMDAIVKATDVQSTVTVDGRGYYVGRLAGVHVVLGLTGIGIVNATNRAASVLANFDVAGMVMSGVAGSRHRIGDVVVASRWTETGTPGLLHPNPVLRALARRARHGLPPLQTCTPVPPTGPNPTTVCFPYHPKLVLGGHGFSGDASNGVALPCAPGGGPIAGCDLPAAMVAAAKSPPANDSGMTTLDVTDNETAAVERAALAKGVPFLGIRAVSDGAGDPKGNRGYPAQFFDYYQLAADNEGAVTQAFVAELAKLARSPHGRGACRRLTKP
jgi:hypothetical protein